MADLNVWSGTGRLTKDAEFRTLASGKALLSCDIAVNTGWGEYAKTTYFRVQQWGERGQKLIPYLKKGKPVAVSGSLSVNEWTRQDGTKMQQLVLDTNSIQFIGGGASEDKPSDEKKKDESLDEIPF